jgi:hypothetical protein
VQVGRAARLELRRPCARGEGVSDLVLSVRNSPSSRTSLVARSLRRESIETEAPVLVAIQERVAYERF